MEIKTLAARPCPLSRRHFVGLATSTLLAGCSVPAQVTRDPKRDPFEGGIGGTGIVGTLTDVDTLRVNGLRAELTSRTRVVTALGPVESGALVAGQTLTVFADRRDEATVARHVRIEYPLVGLLEDRGGALSVNGVEVVPEPGSILRARAGQRVAVSGLWSGERVVASRIDPAPFEADSVAGDVARAASGETQIGGVRVRGRTADVFPASGGYATVTGTYSDGILEVERLSSGRFAFGAGDLRQLSVEGYLDLISRAPGFRIAGLGHSFAEDLRLGPIAQDRAIFAGPYDQVFEARAGYVLPENLATRRQLLRDGFEGALGDRAISTA